MKISLAIIFCLLSFQIAYSESQPTDTSSDAKTPTLQTPEQWKNLQERLNVLGENQAAKEILLRNWLQSHPEDEDALFYLARVLAWQNRYEDALHVYDELLSKSPENADFLLGKAQVFLWQGKPAEALPLLDNAQSISPNYEDIYRAKLQAYLKLNKKAEAEQLKQEAKNRFPEKDWELAVQQELFPLELEAGGGYEHLTNRFRDWNHQYFSFRKPFSKRSGIYGDIIHTERFTQHDLGLAGGAYFPIFKSKWGAAVEGSISPTNRILPQWSAGGSMQRQLPLGFIASAGYRHTEYRDAITEMGIYRLENYWRRLRSSYTLFQSYLHHGGQAFSHMAELDYTYGEHSHIGINGVLGEELANIANAGVLQTDVKAASLFGLQMIRPKLGVTYRFFVHKQGDLYTRKGFQFGLRYFL